MSVLAGMVKNVLVIIIMASFFELLLPEGKLKPFVRFAIGLFILIAVLNPALSYLFSNHDLKLDLWDYTSSYPGSEEILENGNRIQNEIKKQGDDIVKQKLQGQISAVAILVPGVEDVSTEACITDNGSIEKIHLIVRPEPKSKGQEGDDIGVFLDRDKGFNEEEQKSIENKIVNVLHNLYGLNDVQIQIEFEGG